MAEIITCAKCQRKLHIPEQYFGQMVQCPECSHRFVATATSVSAQPMPAPSPAAGKQPVTSRAGRDNADSWDNASRRRRSDYDDDPDDFDDSRRIRQRYIPHRGGLVMALGLVSLVGPFLSMCVPLLVLGPVAWALANHDLREMRDRQMDPGGETMTRAGQVCGIIATVLLVIGAGFIVLAVIADLQGW